MGSMQPHPPTLASLARVLPEYGKFRFDRTLEAARNDIGYHPATTLTWPIWRTPDGCAYG
jgi:hypothetical protein